MIPRIVVVLFALWSATSRCALAASSAVESFSPQGEIKSVRQVVARFAQPMVPLTDPRGGGLEPFDIDCAPTGRGRWVDSRNWVYDFDQDLSAGVRCTFTLRADLVDLAGGRIGTASFDFNTGGPAVSRVQPWPESEIDEDQAFVLYLDGEATRDSVLANSWFTVEGIAERIGAHLIEGDARAAILESLYEDPGATPVLVLQAKQRFPNGSKVTLTWGEGIESPSGPATTTEQTFSFETRKPFAAELSCSRENAKADCSPLSRLRLSFSAPVPDRFARAVVLRGADGREWKPTAGEHGEPAYGVEFKPPFPERATFTLALPPGLHDDAGRHLANADRFPLTVKTAPYPPLAKFSSRFGIIESEAEPVLPVTVRRVEPEVQTEIARVTAQRAAGLSARLRELWDQVTGNVVRLDAAEPDALLPWLRRVAWSRRSTSVFDSEQSAISPKTFKVPKPHAADELEVVGVPLGSPGLYIVELESLQLGEALLGKESPMYVATAALVTNLGVHFKWGAANSLVWVTTLDDAEPVREAEVIIQNCAGKTVWTGTTDEQGIARVEGLPSREEIPNCYSDWSRNTAKARTSGSSTTTSRLPTCDPWPPACSSLRARGATSASCIRAGSAASRAGASRFRPSARRRRWWRTPSSTAPCSAPARRCT